jgi:thioredoxin reductase (NADPH)
MEETNNEYDLLIIGSGPAGLTAGIYAGRYRLKTIIISGSYGGMTSTAHKVCNFPSYKDISGIELINKMKEQAEEFGVEFEYGMVENISNQTPFIVKTSNREIKAKKIIFATGTKHRELNIESEKKFIGRGVSYCATCDGAFFRDKVVAVIGGGDSAITAAILLSQYATKVYIIHRKSEFNKAEKIWIEQLEKNNKIEKLMNEELKEVVGSEKVEKIILKSGKEIQLQGIFVEIGVEPETKLLDELNAEKQEGYIKTDDKQETSIKGIFAAGDITTNSNKFKQIITACSEGAIAANSAYYEIECEK